MNEVAIKGKYFIGDPFYALSDKYYTGIWGNEYGYESCKFNINGFDVIIHSTHYGDGEYKDTRDRIYIIKSGAIGLIPIELLKENVDPKPHYGHTFEFTEDINFIYDAGLVYIKSGNKYISIDTRNMDEYDSEYEEHCENDNGEPITKTIASDLDDDLIEECDPPGYDQPEFYTDDQLFEPKPISPKSFFKKR